MTEGTNVTPLPTVKSLLLAPGRPFGENLRTAREFLGLTQEDIVKATKIRPAYVRALEATELALLPSRPFTEGYVRAYARVLGVDEAHAVGRLRQDWPMGDGALPEPMGVTEEADPRIAFLATAVALVVVAIVIWNIATRAMADRAPPESAAIATSSPLPAPPAKIVLGHPLPPPIEATLPAPYITPGLEPEEMIVEPASGVTVAAADELIRPFRAKGKIYGAPAEQSLVTLQATSTVWVILRNRGDDVQEIQELRAGEAYRAPSDLGLALDVTAPSSVEVYVAGLYKGRLTQPVTKLSALAQ